MYFQRTKKHRSHWISRDYESSYDSPISRNRTKASKHATHHATRPYMVTRKRTWPN